MGVTITINGTNRTAVIPFSDSPKGEQSWITVTETVPGSATAKMKIYDLTNSIVINRFDPIIVFDTTNTKNIFQGYVQKRQIDVVATYRIWTLDCVDLNSVTDTTLVGVPNGTSWQLSAGGQWTPLDPNAVVNGGSDVSAAQNLISAYWVYPVSLDTTTYMTVTNPAIATPDGISWNRVTLRQALNDVATAAGPFTVWWIDADAKLHWTNKPQTGAPSGPLGTQPTLPTLFPQGPNPPLVQAPYGISDAPDFVTTIPYENFTYILDDSGGAFALYANGATDYTRTVTGMTPDGITSLSTGSTTPPSNPYNAYYTATLTTAPIQIYSRDNQGCIHQPYWSYGSPGQVLYVNPIYITPCSTGGGHFWEIKNGTPGTIPNGYLIPQTNSTVIIAPITTPPPPPPPPGTTPTDVVGVGGTGWVNGSAPSWLSRYIDLPDAMTQADRDMKGTVALQYMSQSVVRGTADVVRPGILYRAGMQLTVTSTPAGLISSPQMIQRVTTTFLSGTDERRASMEWGTAPLGSIGLRRQAQQKPQTKLGALQHKVSVKNTNPMPGSTITISTQLVNASGEPWRVAGKIVDWSVQVFDSKGNDVTATSQGGATGWSLAQNETQTYSDGSSSTQLTLATATGYQYFVTATSPD